MTFRAAGAYAPAFWSISSHDIRYVERCGGSVLTTNTAWVANLAVYVPFTIDVPSTIYEWWHENGTLTTAYNVDYGIYNLDFTKVQSLGTTAGTTTASSLVNTTSWTDLVVVPGSYYMAFASDSTRNFLASSDALGLYQASGVMEQTTAFPLPSPAVPLVYARAFLPHFGMNLRAVAL
jgi:hypothetical protein